MINIERIENAFRNRKLPKDIHENPFIDSFELEQANQLASYNWEQIDCDLLEEYFDIFPLLTPEAFVYYIPSVIKASLVENEVNLLIIDSFLNMLDRSPDWKNWDEFFIERWPLLTEAEYDVFTDWLLWMKCKLHESYYKEKISRSIDTIKLVKKYNNS